MKKRIFITGGAGYIGSHTCVEIMNKDHEVCVFDNLQNSSIEALRRVRLLTNKQLQFAQGDIRDKNVLINAMQDFAPTSIIHFAGLKAVADSIIEPLSFYDTNVVGSINLLNAMSKVGCYEIIFSSSATVYGEVNDPPFTEIMPVAPTSPYGQTKLIFENILKDWTTSHAANRAVILRYFNPVGAHASGLIGEDPKDTPNNLMPLIVKAAQKKSDELSLFGSDYDTRDGTGERDYIHVEDLAHGHLKALDNMSNLKKFQILNLGSCKSTTVRELITTFEKINHVSVPTNLVARRPGDVAISLADPTLSRNLIGFECKKTIEEMCKDTWNWVRKNPNGYE